MCKNPGNLTIHQVLSHLQHGSSPTDKLPSPDSDSVGVAARAGARISTALLLLVFLMPSFVAVMTATVHASQSCRARMIPITLRRAAVATFLVLVLLLFVLARR